MALKYIAQYAKDDIVLDPFMGSGTSAVAALKLGRKFIGYEINSTYLNLANLRIAEEQSVLFR